MSEPFTRLMMPEARAARRKELYEQADAAEEREFELRTLVITLRSLSDEERRGVLMLVASCDCGSLRDAGGYCPRCR